MSPATCWTSHPSGTRAEPGDVLERPRVRGPSRAWRRAGPATLQGPTPSQVTCWNGPASGTRAEPGDVLERPRVRGPSRACEGWGDAGSFRSVDRAGLQLVVDAGPGARGGELH